MHIHCLCPLRHVSLIGNAENIMAHNWIAPVITRDVQACINAIFKGMVRRRFCAAMPIYDNFTASLMFPERISWTRRNSSTFIAREFSATSTYLIMDFEILTFPLVSISAEMANGRRSLLCGTAIRRPVTILVISLAVSDKSVIACNVW